MKIKSAEVTIWSNQS